MPTDMNAEVKKRYRNALLVQLTEGNTTLNTVDDTVLNTAIQDAKSEYEIVLGEDFEYPGITSRELNFQINQVATLTIWILQARLARESLHSDTRYEKWVRTVTDNRNRNKIIDPIGNTDVTEATSRPATQPRYPQMQDPNFDNFVPGNSDDGRSQYNPRSSGGA